MRVCLVAIGSTGDVAPLLGVADHLARSGFAVTVATHASFEPWVTALGLSYARLPMEPRAELTEERAAQMRRGPARAARAVQAAFAPYVDDLAWAIDAAADDTDILLLSAMAWPGIHSARARGIPSIGLHLQPLEPTAAFPPPAASLRSLGSRGNRALGRLVQRQMVAPYMPVVNAIRRKHSLAPTSAAEHLAELTSTGWPVLVGVSEHVVPTPDDWRPGVRNVGFWAPPPLPGWEPDRALTDFVGAGPSPVVYIGFGSTSPAAADTLGGTIARAVETAGVRAVVATGWSGLDLAGHRDRVHQVDAVDHRWLFPRVSAAVHHAGAGTTAAAAGAGVVSVPVPLGMDQPFWAHRLHQRGLATQPIPARRLTADRLGAAISQAVRATDLGARAGATAELMRREDAFAAVVDQIELSARERPPT